MHRSKSKYSFLLREFLCTAATMVKLHSKSTSRFISMILKTVCQCWQIEHRFCSAHPKSSKLLCDVVFHLLHSLKIPFVASHFNCIETSQQQEWFGYLRVPEFFLFFEISILLFGLNLSDRLQWIRFDTMNSVQFFTFHFVSVVGDL